MNKGKELLSNLKFYESYAKWNENLGRKETWEESVKDVMSMHRNKFKGNKKLLPFLDIAEEMYSDGRVLASQRSLQYREAQVIAHNHRIFNCSSTYIDRPEVFGEAMYVLLGGCGVGYSVERRFVNKLPSIHSRENADTVTHIIEDSIEGWAESLNVLMMSYFNGGPIIRFDGSKIRPEGSYISGGFRAPGYEPLRKALELIEKLLESKIENDSFRLTSLDCHEIICIASDSVLAAGVRRSAIIVLFDKDDELMLKCKTGNWFYEKPWLGRANNSAKLLKGEFTKEEFDNYKEYIKQFGEPGIVLVDDIDFCTNPCVEIGFIPINPATGNSCWSFCNLNEINGGMCKTEEDFYEACKAAAIIGTLQCTYTNIPFLGQDTKDLMEYENLLGISITGIMDNPHILLNPEILQKGAAIVVATNEELSAILDINPSARLTCVKPSGNASVLLGTSSGIHAAHSRRYIRIMQMNKDGDISKMLLETNPSLLETSVWSSSGRDYAVFIPIEEDESTITKDQINDIQFMEYVKIVYQNWVLPGNVKERGYSSRVTHNVSNTISVNDWDRVFDYIYENQQFFCGLSFMAELGDKVYKQAPFTKVMTLKETIDTYGVASIFASGLIVDSLHAFDNDLWDACEASKNKDFLLSGDRYKVLLKKDVVRRIKKFAKSYFKNNIEKTIDCLKNIHIFHKFDSINRNMKEIDFSQIKTKPEYTNVNEMGAVACSGNSCEITRI